MGARTWTLAVLLLLQVTVGAGSDDPAPHDVRIPAVTLDGSDGAATPRSSPPEGTPVGAARCTPENASRCPVVSLERGAAETDTRGPRGQQRLSHWRSTVSSTRVERVIHFPDVRRRKAFHIDHTSPTHVVAQN